jgi:CheY-like chemotaxis protein
MEDLRTFYRQALPERIAALEPARAALDPGRDADAGDQAIADIRRIAHSLRGSGGTYGFPEISLAAGMVEDAADGELPERLDSLLELLRDEAAYGHDAAGAPAPVTAGMDILLVDDDPEIRYIAAFLLEQAGHRVRAAEDGATALEQVRAVAPDVLLMDVLLGEEDGVSVAAELLAACAAGTRLIFLTAASRPEQLDRMQGSAAAGTILKPFDPGTFALEVAALAGGSEATAS